MNNDKTLFDAKGYQNAYPDVAQSGLSPRDHYELYGRMLGRNPAPKIAASAPWADMTPAELDRALARGPLPVTAEIVHDDLVSIIMPSYNNVEWIARAIHSVLSQQAVKVELIVVDDGSTDGSVGIARQIAAHAPNVRVISLLRNFGCYYARNIGVTEAQGVYVTIIDSDDIMVPDRILRQLNALKAYPEKQACLARTRRWSADMRVPMGDVRYAENTLLWKRSLVDEIGYYDTVRFGGDTEFRVRLESFCGKDAIVRIPDEVYFLRTLDTSLTTAMGSSAYVNTNGVLEPALSDDRRLYSENLAAWLGAPVEEAGPPQRTEFPQLTRSFALGSPEQNASPSLGQRRVGAMASFPPRRGSLEGTIASILPQLDSLVLYLNNYDDVPDFVRHPKIRVVASQEALGDLRDNGKFFDLPEDDNSYVFTLDDDLIYPHDYTARMIHQIEMLGRSCVVGVHGVIFPDDDFSRLNQRTVFHFKQKTPGRFVDLLGTGTTAWHSSLLKPSLEDFRTMGVCDLWFATLCAHRKIPLYSVPRRKNWINEFAISEVSLWKEAAEQPQGYFDLYENVVAPALDHGRVRKSIEAQLTWGFCTDVLTAADITFSDTVPTGVRKIPQTQRDVTFHPAPYQFRKFTEGQPHFHIVLSGHNTRKLIDKTLRSIAGQHHGFFTCDVTIVDDGSTDGSLDKLAALSILPTARIVAVGEKTGAAYGRDLAIRNIHFRERDTFIIPLTAGDVLDPYALATLAEHTVDCPDHDLIFCHVHASGQGKRMIAFRRHLYASSVDSLQDEFGCWLDDKTTDALTGHLMQHCAPDRITVLETSLLVTPDSATAGRTPNVVDHLSAATQTAPLEMSPD